MGKSKKIAIENYQKFQSVAHWSHRSENQICEKVLPIGLTVADWSLLPIGLTHCIEYGEAPNLIQRRNHSYEFFTALSTNLPNWYERTAFEGFMITQLQPTLNKQLKYRKSNLICTCISRINDSFEQKE